ncbi:butyrophilin-like protein 2 isoform X4 [Pteronotus mesoamericanus]|uniref:butyrophilin-like protein 2 isoform X4 n=1 Tax=Pteronotus mesoamericanus TaxID=1884717 RepID=UPI0023ECC3E4|nr:butyrophilin-like protein 2 isoform X4 [Pteronotus parnellii mesoamericanus]
MVDFPGYSLSGAVASFFFILLTMKQSVDFRVIGPAHPILARVGEDAQLTCQLLPKRTAVHMEVRWYRWEPSADVLFVYRDGAEVTEMQTEDYRGRVQWVEDDLAEGTVALKMYNIRPSDDGQYWCSFQEGNSRGETSLLIKVAEKLQNELASLKVIGPSQPLLVRVGEDIQLTCYLSPKANAQSMEVRWVRSHRYPAVYVYMDGDHVSKEQMAEYKGRTALVTDALSEGRLTLHIRNTSISDDGQYRCLFEKDGVYQESSLDLKVVGLGSSPQITMEELKDGEMQLMCSSEGWFPQPRVQWRDMEGMTVPSFSEVLTQGSHGLFHVETFLLVPNSSVVNLTCSISNPLLGEEKMATFSSSDFRKTSSWKILFIFGLLLLATVGLIKRKSCRNVNVTLDPNAAPRELNISEGKKNETHRLSCNQTSHRNVSVCSMLRVRGLTSGRW